MTTDRVFGADGLTYSNTCVAERAGVEIAGKGICGNDGDDPDACGEALDPVCGDDGVTYDNDCQLGNAGVTQVRRSMPGRLALLNSHAFE